MMFTVEDNKAQACLLDADQTNHFFVDGAWTKSMYFMFL